MATSSNSTGGYNPTFSTRNTHLESPPSGAGPDKGASPEDALSDVTGGYNPTFSTRGGNTDTSASQVETAPANDTSSETALSDVAGGYNPTFSTRGGNTDTSASQVETAPANDTSSETAKSSGTLTLDTSDTLKTLLTTLGDMLNTIISQATATRPAATNEKFQTLQDTLLSSTTSIATKATESLEAFNKALDSLIQLNEETTGKINTLETTTPQNTQSPENTVRVNIEPASATSPHSQNNVTNNSNSTTPENETQQTTETLNDSPSNTNDGIGNTTLSSAEQQTTTTQPNTGTAVNQLPADSPVAPEGLTKPIDKALHVTSHSPAQTMLSAAMDDIRATYPSVPINNSIQAEIAAELMGQNTNPGSQQPADTIHLTDQQIRILSDAIAHNINVRRQMAAQQMIADANLDGFGYGGADFELGSVSSDFQQAVLEICEQVIQSGIPYAWGGGSLHGPSQGISDNGNFADANGDYAKIGFDCSGFSRYVFYQATGVEIPRTAAPQCDYSILIDEPMIGDLGFPTNHAPGHVVVYVGNGEVAEAQQSGTNLMYSAASPTYVWKRPPESPNWDY